MPGHQAMRTAAGRARAARDWLAGRGEELEGKRITAVSAHLDDAVLSVGAALARAARKGADVAVLTVLANDPESECGAREWDRQAGFASAREAALARRAEDRRACELLGVRPVWLPFLDMTYGGTPDDDEEIAAAVLEQLHDADTVLVPGWPLVHEDHRRLAALLLDSVEPQRIRRYVEQPYALWAAGPPPRVRTLAAGSRDRVAKIRASRAYGSQLALLGRRPVYRIARYELLRGGESVF